MVNGHGIFWEWAVAGTVRLVTWAMGYSTFSKSAIGYILGVGDGHCYILGVNDGHHTFLE